MTSIITEQSLGDPILIGVATFILVEIAKRVPKIPVDPSNPNQLKFVSGGIALVLAVVRAAPDGSLSSLDIMGSVRLLAGMWLSGWMLSHVAYKVAPGVAGVAKEQASNEQG